MNVNKATADLLLLLSGITDEQEKINEMYIKRVKESKEWELLEQLDDYIFISSHAKQLASDLRKVNVQRTSIPDIQKEYVQLQRLYKQFQDVLSSSEQTIRRSDYSPELVSKEQLKALKSSNRELYRKLQVIIHSGADEPAEAFRHYLKTRKDNGIATEYVHLRSSSMEVKDQRRASWFRWGGAGIGALLMIVLLSLLLPLSTTGELILIGIGVSLFILGLLNIHEILRFYSVILLIVYVGALIVLTCLQSFSSLLDPVTFENLRNYHVLMVAGMAGGLGGFVAGTALNFVPAPLFHLPRFVEVVEVRMRFLMIAFALYGTIWTIAYKDNMSMLHFAETKLEQIGVQGGGAVQANTKSKKEVGEVTVTAKAAFVRTKPVVEDSTVYTSVDRGTTLTYYEIKEVDGADWYYIKEPKSKEMLWIHGSTVEE